MHDFVYLCGSKIKISFGHHALVSYELATIYSFRPKAWQYDYEIGMLVIHLLSISIVYVMHLVKTRLVLHCVCFANT